MGHRKYAVRPSVLECTAFTVTGHSLRFAYIEAVPKVPHQEAVLSFWQGGTVVGCLRIPERPKTKVPWCDLRDDDDSEGDDLASQDMAYAAALPVVPCLPVCVSAPQKPTMLLSETITPTLVTDPDERGADPF